MRVQLAAASVALLLTAAACAQNSQSAETGAATRDTSITTSISDSAAANQTESGVVDSSGQSTLGPDAEQTRPDQGQPVTSKGDTINTAVDSSSTPQ
jgi:hypothetical protein